MAIINYLNIIIYEQNKIIDMRIDRRNNIIRLRGFR